MMSSGNRYGNEFYKMTQLLSQRVSAQDPFFKEIALMDIESRKKLALLYVLLNDIKIFEMNIGALNEVEMLEKIIYPIIQRYGQAQFRADPLTNLGFKLGVSKDSWNFEST